MNPMTTSEITITKLRFREDHREKGIHMFKLTVMWSDGRLVWRCPIPVFPKTCTLSFLLACWFCLDFTILFLPCSQFFNFPLWAWQIFLCQIPLQYFAWIFSLLISIFNSFFILCKWFDIVYVHRRPCT